MQAGTHLRVEGGIERVEQLGDGILSSHRCLPPAESIVFDADSLFPNGPRTQLRLAPETLVGFRLVLGMPQMAAAAGLVNGRSIRREPWPRRAVAMSVAAGRPISLDGVWLAAVGQSSIADGAIWGGPSILRWGQVSADPEAGRNIAVQLMSDGYWAEPLPPEVIDDDIVLRCRLAGHARWVRVVSPALLPFGQGGSHFEQRRFGIAVVELCVDTAPVRLDDAGLVSGFYPIEGEAPRQWRWTNGSGLIALEASPSERIFSVRFTNWHEMLEA